jgi:hypothetical protein
MSSLLPSRACQPGRVGPWLGPAGGLERDRKLRSPHGLDRPQKLEIFGLSETGQEQPLELGQRSLDERRSADSLGVVVADHVAVHALCSAQQSRAYIHSDAQQKPVRVPLGTMRWPRSLRSDESEKPADRRVSARALKRDQALAR